MLRNRLLICAMLIASSADAAPLQSPTGAPSGPDRSYVYAWRALQSAGLPDNVLKRRQEDRKLEGLCGQNVDRSALIVGLIVEAVSLGIKAIDKALSAKEDRYLESLSSSSSASNTAPSFPLDARGGTQCLIVDRVSDAGDDRATYVLGLTPIGTNAFTVELLGARLTDRTLIGRRNLPDKVNADIALTFLTVEPETDAGRPEQRTLPVYSAVIRNLDPKLIAPAMANDAERMMQGPGLPQRSPVLPLPRLATPTTISVVVIESNAGLNKAKERVELARKVRGKLIELTGGAISEQIGKLAQ